MKSYVNHICEALPRLMQDLAETRERYRTTAADLCEVKRLRVMITEEALAVIGILEVAANDPDTSYEDRDRLQNVMQAIRAGRMVDL